MNRRVDHGVAAFNKTACAEGIAQAALDPLQIADVVEAIAVAGRPMQTTKLVPLACKVCDDIAADESRGACKCNSHHSPFVSSVVWNSWFLRTIPAQLPQQVHFAVVFRFVVKSVNDPAESSPCVSELGRGLQQNLFGRPLKYFQHTA